MYPTPSLCTEMSYLLTQSYRETEDQHGVIRRTKTLAQILSEMTVYIEADDLIVGRVTSKRKAGPLLPEVQWLWYLYELDTMSERETDSIEEWTKEEKNKVIEITDYWKGWPLTALIPLSWGKNCRIR